MFNIKKETILTIGTFDGVHIGHQKIINRLVEVGRDKKLKTVVLTFFPHPRMVLQKNSDIKLLNTIQEREVILSSLGLDQMVIKTFTKEFANLSAEEFVKSILVDGLNAKYIIIGYDHQFGKDRSANIEDLKLFGKTYGFEVEEISAQDVKDVAVSSTKIRTALDNGDISTANSYLGYSYFFSGTVIKGKGLGKKLDFPTANIHITEDYKLIPKEGVYVVKSTIKGTEVFGMMNIGNNPTVNGKHQSIEVHLFNFDDDIYGEMIKIEFLERLRDEQKFDSIELLKAQLHHDKINAENFMAKHG
ncbi:MAG TPA: bifunctional riboflavin kinase/FAD synthetase [Aquaticitalea sp.]|nr:bifunctional riboflavin kinase/FAD synthetase [Aquaticitalea sp.]